MLVIVPPVVHAAVPNKPTINILTPHDGWVWLGWIASNNATRHEYSSDDGLSWTSTTGVGVSINNLTNGQDYIFKVRACNNDGCSASDERQAYPTAGPAAPTVGGIVTLTAVPGHKRMKLRWANPDNAAITSYEYSVDSVDYNDFADIPGSTATTTEYTVARRDDGSGTALSNGTTYTFAVRAVDANGGGAPATKSATPVPTAPTAAPPGFTASPANEYIQTNWAGGPSSDLPDPPFTYLEAGIKETSSSGGLTWTWRPNTEHGFTHSNLTNGTEYTVGVRACNTVGCGPAVTENATPNATVPGRPRDVEAAPGDGQVTLTWTAPSTDGGSDIERYEYKAGSSGSWVSVNLELTATVTNLTNGTEHDFWVRAVNAVGNSGAPKVSATPNPVPAAPANLTATAGDARVTLSWDDPDNASIQRWEYRQKEGTGAYGGWGAITNSDKDTTSHTVTGLTNGTAYSFRVRAVNASGNGAVSTASATPVAVPGAPTNLTAAPSVGQVALDWSDPDNDTITSYQVSTDGGDSFTDINGSDKDTTSHTVTGLTNGTVHTLAVRAVNASGPGAASTKTVTMVPAAPSVLTAAPGDAQVTLHWTDPDNDTITSYQVSTDGGSFAGINGSDKDTTSHTVTGLTNGTAYSFRVRAVNASGNGAVSAEASATPVAVPGAPTDLTAAPSVGQVSLSWSDPGNDTIIIYQVSTDGGDSFTDINGSDKDTTSHTVTGLTNGTVHTLAVRAVNASGPGAASTKTVTMVPAAPSVLTAAPGDAQVTLHWTDPDNDTITSYQVSTDGGSFAGINGSDKDTTSHTVTGLTNGTAYSFRVRAVNASGNGAVSAEASATPVAVPGAPTDLTAAPSVGQVSLSWSDPDNDTIIIYQVSTDGGDSFTDINGSDKDTTSHTVTGLTNGTVHTLAVRAVNASGPGAASTKTVTMVPAAPSVLTAAPGDAQVTLHWTDPDNDTITSYQVSTDGGSFAGINGSDKDTTSHTVTGLTNGTAYSFRVRAVNASGNGAVSAEASATPVAVPGAPTDLTAAPSVGQVSLSWSDPDNDTITSYQVSTDGGSFAGINGSDKDTTSHTVTGLTNGTVHTLAVRAVNASGPGAASTKTVTMVPAAPSVLTAAPGDAQVTLHWTDPDNDTITSYQVSTDGGSFAGINGSDKDTTSHTVTGLTNGTAYSFRVRAVNASGNGAVSAEASATPVAVPGAPTNLTAAPSVGQVALDWSDPDNDTITSYQVSTDGGDSFTDINGSDKDTTSHTVTGLTNGTVHTLAVRAVNASGPGAASTKTVTMVPAAPSVLTAAPSVGQVALDWSDPDNDTITSYQVSTDGGSFADINGSDKDTTSHTVTGLTNGTVHTLAVRAVNASGPGAASTKIVTMVPAAPSSLTALPGDAQVTLYWTDLGDATITGYEVSTDGGSFADIDGSGGAATTSHTVTGLTNGTAYSFRVRAVNASGNGAVSAEASATPVAVPGAPTNLTAAPSVGQVSLSWSDPGNDTIIIYQVSTDGGDSFTDINGSDKDTTSHTVTGLTNGTVHTLAVRAVNVSGPGAASTKTVTMVPAAPSSLTATGSDGQVGLSWDNPGNASILRWESQRKEGAGAFGNWTAIYGSDKDTTGYTVTGLTNGTAYAFKVRAVNATGDGAASSIGATPVADVDDTQPSLATIADQTYTEGVAIATLTLPASSSGNGALAYSLSPDPPAGLAFDAATRTLSGTPTAVGAATAYTYTARDEDGDTASRSFSIAVQAALPAAPAGLAAAAGAGQVALAWDNPGNATITGYDARQKAGNGTFGNWTAIAGSDKDTTGHTVTGLTNGTAYTFELRAVNATGDGAASSIGATPLFPAPAGLAAAAGDAQVTLSWDNPNDTTIAGYELSTDGGAFAAIGGSGATTTGHTVTGLTNGTAYTFKLRAVNGRESGEVAATPVADADDTQPSLAAIADRTYTVGVAITTLTLPLASGGNGTLSYTLSPAPPAGLAFDAATRTLSGTPAAVGAATAYTYTARDEDGDTASRSFSIAVQAALPAAPAGLAAAAGAGQVALSWDNPGDDSITGYDARQKAGSGTFGNWTAIANSSATTTGHTVTGLTNGTAYTFELRAVNATGDGAASSIGATPLFPAPAGLAAAAGDAQVTLSWDNPNDTTIAGYELSTDGGAFAAIGGSGATTIEHTVTGLTNGTAYTFKLRAVNGRESGEVAATPLFPAPAGLAATAGDAQVTLSWDNPNDTTIAGYELSTDGGTFAAIGGSGATTTGHTVTGLTNGTAYTFKLRAVNGRESGEVAATPVADVDDTQPSLAAIADRTYTEGVAIALLTLPASSSGNGELVYSLSPAPPAGLAFDAATRTLSGTPTAVGAATAYTYTARDEDGDTASRSFSIAVQAALPAAPAGLAAAAGAGQVALSWDNPGNATITGYDARQKAGSGTFGNWTAIANSSATTTGHTVTGLTNGTAYTFELRAVNATGDGAASSIGATPVADADDTQPSLAAIADRTYTEGVAIAPLTLPASSSGNGELVYSLSPAPPAGLAFDAATRTLSGTPTAVGAATAYTYTARDEDGDTASRSFSIAVQAALPAAPAGLAAAAGAGQVALSWDNPGNATITGYDARQKAGNGTFGNWTAIAGSDKDTTGHTVTGLTNGTAYTFELRAVNATGDGAASSIGATPLFPAPAGLAATAGDAQVTLSWDNPNDTTIAGYELSTDGGTFAAIGGSSATTIEHTVTGLTNGTAYKFKLRAVNGRESGEVAATPVADADDTQPSLAAIADRTYTEGVAIAPLTLPASSSGNGALAYSLSPAPPAGLAFDAATRTLSGTPTAVGAATAYTYTARDEDGDTASRSFSIAVQAALPAAPAGLAAAAGAGQVALSWDNPGNATITGYDARQKAGNGTFGNWTAIAGSDKDTTGHTVTGLTNGTAYTFELRAVNATGDGAASSIGATPLFPAPAGLAAAAGDAQVTLSWDNPNDTTIAGYELSTDGGTFAAIGGSSATTIEHTVTGLTNGTAYTFELRAVNGRESGEVAATPLFPAPAGLAATAGDAQVTLSWDNPNDTTIAGYELSTDGGTFAAIGGSSATTIEHTVTGLTNGTAYTFKLRAVNGRESGEVAATPVADADDTQPSLAAIADRTYTEGVAIAPLTLPASSSGNGELVYSLSPAPPAGLAFDAATRTLSGTPTAVGAATAYTYTARDEDGDTASRSFSIAVQAALPAAPAGLAAAAGAGQVALSWDNPGNATITGYDARQKAGNGTFGNWTAIAGSDKDTTGHTVTGLTNGTAYTFELRAVNGTGDGAASSIGATPLFPAPAGLAAAAGDAQVTLSWDNPNDTTIAGYELSTDGGTFAAIGGSSATTIEHTVTGLTNGTAYTFKLRAVNGRESGEVAATPVADVDDTQPSLATIADQTYTEGVAIAPLTLPASSSGNGELVYSLSPDPPADLAFDASARTLSGTPKAVQTAIAYTYTARDENGDTASRSFSITVQAALPAVRASSDATLADLAISPGTLNEPFAAGTTSYTADVGNAVASVTVTATANDDGATVTVEGAAAASGSESGAIALAEGAATTVTVVVMAEDATTTATYTIAITRAAKDKVLVELKVNFGQAAYTMMEGQQVVIEMQMSPTADRRVEMPLVVTPTGGATDEDYRGVPATVVFEEGESERTISVEALADELNDPGEAIVLSFGEMPEAVIGGEISQTTVNFGQRRTARQFSQTQEAMLAVVARSMAESAQTAIKIGFERHRQWSHLGSSGGGASTPSPAHYARTTTLTLGGSAGTGSEGAAGESAEDSAAHSACGATERCAATASGWNSHHPETGKRGLWLRSFTLGPLGNIARSDQTPLGASPGSDMEPSGGVYGQDRQYDSGVGGTPLGLDSKDFSGTKDLRLSLSEISFEMSPAESGKETGWVPVLWGQGDLQRFNGGLSQFGMDYRGGLDAAHVGLDLYANEHMLAGLSFMRSWGDLDYTDDGVDGMLKSRMNTVHPYLYWQPNDRLSAWGIGGLGAGQVEVKEPGRTHGFDADFWMLAGGVRTALSRRDNNVLGLRADGFTTQFKTDVWEDIDEVSGEAHRGRLMLEWVHDRELSAGSSLSVQAEAGGRFDGGDADRGAGLETGVRLGYLDANRGLDVVLLGRVLAVHESGYRDWGLGMQAGWDPGKKQRGFRASVTSSWGRDGEGRTTLWDNSDAVTRPARTGAMGIGSQYRMESEVAYAGMKALGIPGLLTPYSRLRWDGQGRELTLGTTWSPSTSAAVVFELEAVKREARTGPADLGLLLRASIPVGGPSR